MIPLLILAAVCVCAFVVGWRRGRKHRKPSAPPTVGFLSASEQAAILASEHVVRVFPGSRVPVVAVETRFKYPSGETIIIEADVVDGQLTLVEPEGRRAIDLRLVRYERHPERQTSGIYPKGSEAVFEQSGCFVGPLGRIQYGPVAFSPKALEEGLLIMVMACSDIYALPA